MVIRFRLSLRGRPGRLLAFICLLFAAGAGAATNGVLRELYSNIPGTAVSALTSAPTFPASPDAEFLESAFEAPQNFSDNYGQRMRALAVPPVTGSYVFWIASDDNSVLYLSRDEDPAHKVQIASESSWTGSRAWNTHASQKSAPVSLTNGFRYYIEALQKEGGGGDNLAVTWQKPGDPAPANGAAPIPGTYLIPVGLGPPVINVQPTNAITVEGGSALFSVQLAHTLGALYQWYRGSTALPDGTNASYFISPAGLSDSGSTFWCAITNGYGWTNSATATLTVNPDTTRPTLNSVGNLGDLRLLTVIFSEPMEAASATDRNNYTLDGGVSVLAASFGTDSRTVILTTTPMIAGATYTLTVNNVRDRATTPNTILPNTQRTFSLVTAPLDISFVRPAPEPIGPSSRHGPIILSEIMYHPTNRVDGKNLEFIELYNSNPFSEDLSGFRLAGQVDYTFPTNTQLAGRAYLVVASSPADLASVYSIANVVGPYTNKLANSSGTVRLLNREGGVVFEVNYSGDPPWPVAADGTGHSLVLARPSLGEANPAAWAASDVFGGSPGRAEVARANPARSVVINEFLAHTDPPDYDFIELFNYSASPVDLSGLVLSDDPGLDKFVIPTNTIIPPQGFVAFDERQLGFALSAAGETIYFKDVLNTRVLDAVRFGAQENGISTGRFPDGAPDFYRLRTKTPGAQNGQVLPAEVGINEIMYDPVSGDDNDQYIELYNRTDNSVDLSRWTFEAGIKYTIPQGILLPGHGYLVIARNAARLLSRYPNLAGALTLGDFSGSLAHGGERVALARPDELISTNAAGLQVTNTIHIVVDEVTYGSGGRWGTWAHGGGSSLELKDPESDHRLAPNWADSDETLKSAWTNIEFTGVLDNGSGNPDSLQIILLGPGECLVDNVEVFTPGGANRIANSDFESGLSGWFAQGNHEDSSWETGQGYNSFHCLHLRATDHGDTGANRIRTALTSALSPGQTATLRAKVRWLRGRPEILLRLHGNWLEATGYTLTAASLGTPGAVNSQSVPNAGPAITAVKHSPPLPLAGQTVSVVASVSDPDGLAALLLYYRVDPSTNLNIVPMVNNGAGLFSATIPGQTAGKLAAFYLRALDNAAPRRATLFPNDAPARECLVRWGDPAQPANYGTYRLWMTQATLDRWSQREHLSNKPLDCTFVYGSSRVVYNIGGEYSGSPWHAPGFNSPIGNVCDYLLVFPDDDPLLGETDATLQWPGNGGGDSTYQREQTAYWIAEQLGLPWCYRRSINLYVNGVRRAELFEDVQQPNGDMAREYYPDASEGDLHKIQIWFEFDDPAVIFTSTGATLQKITTTGGQKKLAFYRWTFAKRAVRDSASNYTNLFALVDAANFGGLGQAYRRQLERTLDVDNWLKTYAVEHIVGNNDSFAYGGGQNMYTFKPVADTWKMMIWDIDFAFAAQDPASDVFQGIGRSNGIDLGEPAYRRRYWQILQDLANGPLVSTKIYPVLDAKYNAMVAAGRTVDSPSGIKSYVTQRRANLLNLISTNVPAAFSITFNGGADFSTNRNLLSLTGTAPIDVRTITINGVSFPVTWTSVSNWSAQIALTPGLNALLVQGWGAAGNLLAGATINLSYTGVAELPEDKLRINEIMYHPAAPNASFVELFNSSTNNAFDLSGWRLQGVDFNFPGGTIIPASGFLTVAGDQAGFAAAYGTSISLAGVFAGNLQNNGETLRLIQPGATPAQDRVIDEVRYENAAPWPRGADGEGSSLQLLDPARDNYRVCNWDAVTTNIPAGSRWRYVTASGSATSSTLYMYLQNIGECYIDDIKLVSGSVPEMGANLLADGDFESGFPGPWVVSPNLSGSSLSTSLKHSGAASLHMVSTNVGTTGSSSIYQTLSPALTIGAPYTLSFWVLENTNGGSLVLRLSGSGVVATVDLLPTSGGLATRATPGAPNSLRDSLPVLPPVWLNEVQASNLSGPTDRFGHHHPWAELYNSGPTNLSLAGLFLANNYTNVTQWAFPAGASLAPGRFCTIWLDSNPAESSATEWHAGFTIPAQVGSLALASTNGGKTLILDYLNYSLVHADRSYGPYPDGGSGKRQIFYYPTPGGTNNPASAPLAVIINEWMADNKTTTADPADNNFEDWFELYNPGDTLADLSGFYLGTSLTNKTKFLIPDGYVIPAQGHLLVWADDETGQNSSNRIDLHVNFKLSKTGESIGLFAADGTVIDFVTFGLQTTDVSEGRFPDGGSFISALTEPTPRASNILAQPNTPPVISNLADRVIFEGQLLLCSVSATDTDLPAQKLTFTLDPGAPTNAAINPDTGLLSWRPTPEQAPGTNLITVRVTDDGLPPLSAVASFTVQVAPLPRFLSVQPGANCSITFVTVPGKSYALEYKNFLQDLEWLPLASPVLATGDSLTLTDASSATIQRFYRILASDIRQ